MGWDGIHLYYFDIHAVHYGSFELDAESPDTPLSRTSGFAPRIVLPTSTTWATILGARGAHREIPGPEAEANLPRPHRWRRGRCPPEQEGGRPSRVPGMARGGDGLGCVVRPGPWSSVLSPMSWRARASGCLTEGDREAIEAALERMEQRQPFLDTTFSRTDCERMLSVPAATFR